MTPCKGVSFDGIACARASGRSRTTPGWPVLVCIAQFGGAQQRAPAGDNAVVIVNRVDGGPARGAFPVYSAAARRRFRGV
jgi:hypothetical protein